MSDFTRRQLIRRGATGASVLTLPGLLAACGGSSGIKPAANNSQTSAPVKRQLAKTLNFSNWPLYIDDVKGKKHPTLDAFTKKFGVKVKYTEDINDNPSFFGKIQGPLSHGQSVGRDLIVMTDT